MSDLKVCNSQDLITLCHRAIACKFNRQVDVDQIKALDLDGLHLVSVLLPFHNLDHAAVAHHRCMLYIKVQGSNEPLDGLILDVAVSDFDRLTDAEKVLADA